MSRNLVKGEYDVVICGAGLAGLTLARQLKQTMPDLSVVVIDRLARPLPVAAFKVGESLVETGSYYLSGILNLADYLDRCHLRKLGFRFFFSSASDQFHDRPEFGLSAFPRVNSYQIDRGVLENDLREFNADNGVIMLEGYSVQDICLSDGHGMHEVVYRKGRNGQVGSIRARWVIDAMGRRRFLQKRLGLTKEHGDKCSATWFRLAGRIDVGDLVPGHEESWHRRVPENNRYYSTNHLMGDGYWVWLIPLASDNTSVGIVVQEELHPYRELNTFNKALQWLARYEPALASYLKGCEPLDFRCMRDYSYSSRQLFSSHRWVCIGEAALFPDPFYALASDLIGFANSAVTELVKLDLNGQLTPDIVQKYDKFILALNHWLTINIQVGYRFFGNPVVMAAKIMWDTAGGWANLGPQMYNSIFLKREVEAQFRRVSGSFFFLTRAMQQMFVDWAARSPARCSYEFLDFLSFPFLREMQLRNLQANKTADQLVKDQIVNMEKLEEFAQVLFLLAVEDVMPEHLDHFTKPIWLNAWAITLDSRKWATNGLFEPTSSPRDLTETRKQLRSLFRFSSAT
jgi:flavin-dependent dehydrogenase